MAERLRTVAEKLEVFGPAQRASQLTFTAADADAFGETGPGREPAAGGRGTGDASRLAVTVVLAVRGAGGAVGW